jgi:hypothetical protein
MFHVAIIAMYEHLYYVNNYTIVEYKATVTYLPDLLP